MPALAVLAAMAMPVRAEERTISFFNIHNKERLSVVYKRDGAYIPAAMKQIDWILRDWRRNEPTQMDPKLIDILWEVHTELGSHEPIHIISGYRSPATNAMLRRTVGGQASKSRHMIGSAADVHFPDIPVQRLRYSALIREKGGVGYYPTSSIPFVHIDTGGVRAWPRLPRRELALLFPSGRTQHRPADGGSLTREDVVRARANGGELVADIDAFHRERLAARTTLVASARAPSDRRNSTVALGPVLVAPPAPARAAGRVIAAAALTGPVAPRLTRPPRLVERPARINPPAPALDRRSLFQLAALVSLPSGTEPRPSLDAAAAAPTPAAVEAVTAIAAPAFDEEHPDELSYRPFPIAPYLTATASVDDPSLTGLTAPDPTRTLELLSAEATALGFEMRPGLVAARALWHGTFGRAERPTVATPSMAGRRVATVAP